MIDWIFLIWKAGIIIDQRIQGLYGITPNNNLNIALIERVITEHQVNIVQYRHITNDDQLKLN